MLIISIITVIVGLSLLLSTALFAIEVFAKHNRRGQTLGFVFSVLAVPLYLIAFCDRLPGRSLQPRDVLLTLPGVDNAHAHFASSVPILIALIATYALRLGIYTRLFVIPALTLSEEEYNQQDQIQQRANDLVSPVLAYFTFALVLTAIIAGAYALPAFGGGIVMLGLVGIYLFSSFLYKLERSFYWLVVQARIAVQRLWLLGSTMLVYVIVGIGKMERWRRRHLQGADDEQFFERLEESLRQSQRKAMAKIEHEQQLLRGIAEPEGT